jgi:hypothetical protein
MQITATRIQEKDQPSILSLAFPQAPASVERTPLERQIDRSPLERNVEARSAEIHSVDMQEVAARFNRPQVARPQVASFGVETLLKTGAPNSDFNTTTMGKVTFRHVPPLEAKRAEIVTADEQLQQKLEMLCDSLRSRY